MYHRLSHNDRQQVALYFLRGLATAAELSRLYRISVEKVYACAKRTNGPKRVEREKQVG